MPPSSGHLLLPKLWRAAKYAYEKTAKAIRAKFPEPTQPLPLRLQLQPEFARIAPRQPIHRAAAIRQARSRWFSTRAAGYIASQLGSAVRSTAPPAQSSRILSHVARQTSHSPFSSTLRPNLTGGTLGRTAGGYTFGAGRIGGARYFSHTPAAPAQVIQNVSAAMRGFLLSGQKLRFDGIDPITGQKRFKAVSPLQDEVQRRMTDVSHRAPGAYIDFQISPTITALGAIQADGKTTKVSTLNSEGLMKSLSVDFARSLKELAGVLNDLNRLASLGDLPVSLHDRSTIRVRFPGCDAEQVERLCDEVGVQRGRISQDEDFDSRIGADLALLFPFAPSVALSPETELFSIPEEQEAFSHHSLDWRDMMSGETSPRSSDGIHQLSFEDVELFGSNPWLSASSDPSTLSISELGDRVFFSDLSMISRE
ncbi:hypothetical protein VTN49DRAFT_4378 [Thermomyces lanuginosus]|uniref:uncharacterized protein n=1 Tax=Thermomyces lanuginosus TaxID=5541 RepID=UPI00374342D2